MTFLESGCFHGGVPRFLRAFEISVISRLPNRSRSSLHLLAWRKLQPYSTFQLLILRFGRAIDVLFLRRFCCDHHFSIEPGADIGFNFCTRNGIQRTPHKTWQVCTASHLFSSWTGRTTTIRQPLIALRHWHLQAIPIHFHRHRTSH